MASINTLKRRANELAAEAGIYGHSLARSKRIVRNHHKTVTAVLNATKITWSQPDDPSTDGGLSAATNEAAADSGSSGGEEAPPHE